MGFLIRVGFEKKWHFFILFLGVFVALKFPCSLSLEILIRNLWFFAEEISQDVSNTQQTLDIVLIGNN
jgi:hypothetical protein